MSDASLICESKQHIYIVFYRLFIDKGKEIIYSDESVRCIAIDAFVAMSIVNYWLMRTETVWCKDGEEYPVPKGKRDVTIMSVVLDVADIGGILKQYPLPTVFQHE